MTRVPAATLFIALITLAGCASNPEQPAATNADAPGKRIEGVKLSAGVIDIAKKEDKVDLSKDERIGCEKYKPIGSNRVLYRCTTVAEKKASEENAQSEMRKMTAPPPSTGASQIGH